MPNFMDALAYCLSMISGQTLRVCPEGKPVATQPAAPEGMLFRIMLQISYWRNCLALRGGRQASFDPNMVKCKAARIAARRSLELAQEARSAGRGDRALRHHLDQMGAIVRRAMNIAHQPVSGNPDAAECARGPVGLQHGLDGRHPRDAARGCAGARDADVP